MMGSGDEEDDRSPSVTRFVFASPAVHAILVDMPSGSSVYPARQSDSSLYSALKICGPVSATKGHVHPQAPTLPYRLGSLADSMTRQHRSNSPEQERQSCATCPWSVPEVPGSRQRLGLRTRPKAGCMSGACQGLQSPLWSGIAECQETCSSIPKKAPWEHRRTETRQAPVPRPGPSRGSSFVDVEGFQAQRRTVWYLSCRSPAGR